MQYTFPKLYKANTSGKEMEWEISVQDNVIITKFGQVGGKLQETRDIISSGKNLGKVNETTPQEQAYKEAESKHAKQKDKGYVENLSNENTSLAYFPMLAQDFEKHESKIQYPCFVQPKLDGIRCLSVFNDSQCNLFSRQRKEFVSVPHIVEELKELAAKLGISSNCELFRLDGELYNHDFCYNFSEIVSIVKKTKNLDEDHKLVQYHIYDIFEEDKTFNYRYKKLKLDIFKNSNFKYLKLVETKLCYNKKEIDEALEKFMELGYEGAIVRNLDGLYKNSRSFDLQKYKIFQEDDFPIIGIVEGRGKLLGHAGSMICIDKNGKEFEAKLKGDTKFLKVLWEDHSQWKDKILSVRFFGYTNKEKVPRFGIGKCIRDYE